MITNFKGGFKESAHPFIPEELCSREEILSAQSRPQGICPLKTLSRPVDEIGTIVRIGWTPEIARLSAVVRFTFGFERFQEALKAPFTATCSTGEVKPLSTSEASFGLAPALASVERKGRWLYSTPAP